MRFAILALALFTTLSLVTTVQAQTRAQLDVDTTLRPIDRELASIDAESTAATVLYVTGTIVAVAGAGIAVGAALGESGSLVGGGDYTQTIDAGLGIGAVGLVALGIAIGLDVDSGSRRRAHGTRIALSPSLGGCSLSIAGTF